MKAISFNIMLDEAMIIEAEQNYFSLYSSIFHKLKPQEIKNKLNRLTKIFTEEGEKEPDDIIKDRQSLKELLKNKRPLS